jgi:hypothetical protein
MATYCHKRFSVDIRNGNWLLTEYSLTIRGRKRLNSWDIFTVGYITTTVPVLHLFFGHSWPAGLPFVHSNRYTCLNSWPHKLVATATTIAWWKIMVTVRCHARLYVITFTYVGFPRNKKQKTRKNVTSKLDWFNPSWDIFWLKLI